MRRLDPRIHLSKKVMDCRAKKAFAPVFDGHARQ